MSGGAPAHALILLAADVTITKGVAKAYWTTSAKGNRIARMFCETCGTPLFAKSEKRPEYLPVKVGSLDDPSRFRVQANIWMSSAQPWHGVDAAVPAFPRDPEISLTALLELARTTVVKIGRAVGFRSAPGRQPPHDPANRR
ncbi:MAG TPA: GFA family protein [Vineibacter sp.]|nr:GFA family protein [Vineibacter sp.]